MAKRTATKTEISAVKTRQESEKFFETFSTIQLNTTLFIILSATFLINGASLIFRSVGRADSIKIWFMVVIISIISFVFSLFLLSVGNIAFTLRQKRHLNILSYAFFLFGFCVFFSSLIYIVFIIGQAS